MARIKIPFRGITSQSNYQDGECKNIVNLRPKKGVYKPVTPRKVLQTLNDDYDIVFVHRGNDYENWIGVKKFTGVNPHSDVYYNIKSQAPILLGDIAGIVNGVQQIGNTLSFVSSDNIYYAIFIDDSYKYLGSMPEIPPIKMGVNITDCYDKLYYKDVLGSLWMYADLPKKEIHSAVVNKARERIINGQSTSGVSSGIKLFDAHLIRYAFRLYDGSVTRHSPPILLMPGLDILSMNRYLVSYLVENGSNVKYDNSYVLAHGYDFTIEYDFTGISAWSDIIKSVDIFISPALGLTSSEYFRDNFHTGTIEINLIDTLAQKQIDNVLSNSLFYHSHTIDLTQGSQSFCGTINKSITNADNIIYQELMIDDSFSHHQYGANGSSSLNNRLRLSAITTKLFSGYSLRFFEWWSDYNGQSRLSISEATWIVQIYIKTSEGTSILETTTDSSFFYNSYMAYPDPRAYKINIYRRTGIGPYMLVFTANLKSHPSMNISYVVSDNLKPFIRFTSSIDSGYSFNYGKLYFTEYNKIKVSEVNNPFVFPNENTYLVGSGKILAESSIVMNVSDRNYGMYPVFVFTTDGVFTMAEQDADTVHASIQSPTYLEPPISKVICATPYGVVFITNRGLMQISNYKTDSLSEILREDDDVLNIDLAGITDPAAGYPSVSFREFLKTATSIVYNPYHDELIISASGYPYNYVYDYETKSFYLSTNLIGIMVQNTFPDVYYITDRNIMDISQSGSDVAKVAILTRPLRFQSEDIKKLERIFMRMVLYGAQEVKIVAYHSMDGVNFSPIKGFSFGSGGNYKDFDLGLLARETFRQYLLLITGEVDERSEIDYIDCEVDLNYNNEKMR
jgi:hypothetical protein